MMLITRISGCKDSAFILIINYRRFVFIDLSPEAIFPTHLSIDVCRESCHGSPIHVLQWDKREGCMEYPLYLKMSHN